MHVSHVSLLEMTVKCPRNQICIAYDISLNGPLNWESIVIKLKHAIALVLIENAAQEIWQDGVGYKFSVAVLLV